jgi:CRP-like cAMP-binding protein
VLERHKWHWVQKHYPGLRMQDILSGLRLVFQALGECAALPDWATLEPKIRVQHFKAKTDIITQGDLDRHVYFVQKGIVRLSYVSASGASQTKSIIAEGASFASLSALEGGLTTFSATTLEAATIVSIPYPALETLMAEHHAWERIVRKVFAALAIKKERREFEFLTMTPLQRWQQFQKDNPTLVARITQSEIAGLIGITPVALSRIKGRQRALRPRVPAAKVA